uniref:G_PROTEIN_RECEP_F1_2 domain-containing protein n=1 Tax=Caenorhabditis tropicalis TaxID=1561998 RepID=A0A1I7T0I0_9PELO
MKRVRRRLGWAIIAVIFISAAQIIPYVYLLDVAPHDVTSCNGFYKANKFVGEVIAGLIESLVWSVNIDRCQMKRERFQDICISFRSDR